LSARELAPVCLAGQPAPLGAEPMVVGGQTGVNFAVFSRHATQVDLCLFSANGQRETARIPLPEHTDGVWHGFVPDLAAGQRYGFRAHGAWTPHAGHRFNAAKLLLDPYAKAIEGDLTRLSDEVAFDHADPLQSVPDAHDNAARMPKSVVVDSRAERAAGAALATGPNVAAHRTVIYETHVRGLTRLHPDVPEALRGTYAGLVSEPMLRHFAQLGVTTLCLLPVHLHIDERHLLKLNLHNHWGYNTLGFFVPEVRYASGSFASVRDEFRHMVDVLHRVGIEIVLDVVYNHTAESDALGPSLCWRGLDNASWYALGEGGTYLNPTGCGNALNMGEPHVVQMVTDSLRWWVEAFGVDGFRFDLATTLARDPVLGNNFHPQAALLVAMAQDPVLSRVKRIAEPWDVGHGGYRMGQFPPGWHEWNDRFRDTVRAYWLGHPCTRGEFARRLTGSSDLFHHSGRSPLATINIVTAHDGFNLADLTAYAHKHNFANGEDNRDGHGHNLSANAGVEGPSDDPAVLRTRGEWRRALLATVLLAQGVPQLLSGDELGHSQQGNNNAYCQDNTITWLDWATYDAALAAFVGGLAALRRRHPGLRHARWFVGGATEAGGDTDIAWRHLSGAPLSAADWDDAHDRSLVCQIVVGEGSAAPDERLLVCFHPGDAPRNLALPPGCWQLLLDSAAARLTDARPMEGHCPVPARSVLVLRQPLFAEAPKP
jgi:glycogen debranching enzyme